MMKTSVVILGENNMTEEAQEAIDEPNESAVEETSEHKGGHMGKEQWEAAGKDPNDWVDKKEFEARGPIFAHIEKLNKKLEDLVAYNVKTTKASEKERKEAEVRGYQKAIAELKEQRKNALEMGDTQQAENINEAIVDRQVAIKEAAKQHIPQEALNFADRNKTWFNGNTPTNRMMSVAASQLENDIRVEYPTYSHDQIFAELERKMQENFPQHFNQSQVRAPVTLSPHQSAGDSKSRVSLNSVDKNTKEMYLNIKSTFERAGKKAPTLDEFIQRLGE